MSNAISDAELLLSLVRALWGNVYPQLRAASIDGTEERAVISLRFEYDGEPSELIRDACESAVTEVIADFWQGHEFEVQHISLPKGAPIQPLRLKAYIRGE